MSGNFDLEEYIMHHMSNSRQWDLPFVGPVELPGFLTLHSLMLILCGIFLILLFGVFYRKHDRVPHGFTNLLEVFVLFVRNQIAIQSLGEEDGKKMAPVLCTFFFLILGLNLMGLIPLFSTATANFNVTGGLALASLSFMIFGAIYKNGFPGFIKSLVPSGVPLPIGLFLLPIEFLGLFIKALALMIRLFANMLAGHIVIFSLLGLVVLLGAKALPAVLLAVFIGLLEIFVAFLQAYIFTMLSAMFIGLVYHPEH